MHSCSTWPGGPCGDAIARAGVAGNIVHRVRLRDQASLQAQLDLLCSTTHEGVDDPIGHALVVVLAPLARAALQSLGRTAHPQKPNTDFEAVEQNQRSFRGMPQALWQGCWQWSFSVARTSGGKSVRNWVSCAQMQPPRAHVRPAHPILSPHLSPPGIWAGGSFLAGKPPAISPRQHCCTLQQDQRRMQERHRCPLHRKRCPGVLHVRPSVSETWPAVACVTMPTWRPCPPSPPPQRPQGRLFQEAAAAFQEAPREAQERQALQLPLADAGAVSLRDLGCGDGASRCAGRVRSRCVCLYPVTTIASTTPGSLSRALRRAHSRGSTCSRRYRGGSPSNARGGPAAGGHSTRACRPSGPGHGRAVGPRGSPSGPAGGSCA